MNVAKLRGIISERGMSQKSVAQAIGMSEKTFYLKMKKLAWRGERVEL